MVPVTLPTRSRAASPPAWARARWAAAIPATVFVGLLLLPAVAALAHPGATAARPLPSRPGAGPTEAGVALAHAPVRVPPDASLPFQAATLSLCNGTLIAGRATPICNPNEAFAVAYDAADHLVFVANSYGIGFDDYVTAYDDGTHAVVYTYEAGFALYSYEVQCLAFDPDHHNLWVAEFWGGPQNNGAVVVLNGSTGVPVASFPDPHPVAAAYDPDQQRMYVADSSGMSVYNASSLAYVHNISAYSPAGLAYDHANKDLYLSEANNSILVYSAAKRAPVVWLGVGNTPKAVTVDPATNDVYVAEWLSSEVTVISGASNTVVGNITGQGISYPWDVAYDSANGSLYVSDWGSLVTVVDGVTQKPVSNFSVGFYAQADGIVYDSGSNRLWIALYGYGQQVDVVDAASGYTFANITPNGASAGAYDPARHLLYITQTDSCTVVPVNVTTGRPGTPFYAGCRESGAAFDPANGCLYVSNYGAYASYGQVAVVNTSTDRIVANVSVGYYADGVLYDPKDRAVFVTSYYNTTEIDATTNRWLRAWNSAPGNYQGTLAWDPRTDVVFVSTGWLYAINATNRTMFHTTVLKGAGVSSAAYDPITNEVWVGGGAAANLTILNASSLAPVGNLSTCYGWSSVLYDRASRSILDTCAADDRIDQIDPASRTIDWSQPLGPSGTGTQLAPVQLLSVDPRGLLATVDGAGSVSWISTGGLVHADAFVAAGVPLGTRWSVDLNGSTTSSTAPLVSFLSDAVSPNYTVRGPPGFVSAARMGPAAPGATNSVTGVAFAPSNLRTYPVTFWSRGLPNGTLWSVRLGGELLSTTASSLRFLATNGTFLTSFSTPNYRPPAGGSVLVTGAAVSVKVGFAAVRFALTFAESGLAAGSPWHVVLDGVRLGSTAASITVNVTNGTYAFRLFAAGYTATPSAGFAAVAGAAHRVTVTFT